MCRSVVRHAERIMTALPPSSNEYDNWILSRLQVLDYVTTVLISLWLSAVPTDAEVADRIEGIRAATLPAIDRLPEPDRHEARAFFTAKMDRIERSIKESRARIAPPVRSMQ
jgi:hypothetical protein